MPTTDSTDRDFHDYLTGANTGVAYNGMSAAGASTHTNPSGPNTTISDPIQPHGQRVFLPGIDAPLWQRIVTGAVVVEGIEVVGMIAGEAARHRLTFILAVLCGIAALAYANMVGVPTLFGPDLPYPEATLGVAGFALPYAVLVGLVATSVILTTLLTAALTLALNLLRMAVGLAVVGAVGYAIYYVVMQG